MVQRNEISKAAYQDRYSNWMKEDELDDLDLIDYTIIHKRTDWFFYLMQQGNFINKQGRFMTYAISGDLLDIAEYLWERGQGEVLPE